MRVQNNLQLGRKASDSNRARHRQLTYGDSYVLPEYFRVVKDSLMPTAVRLFTDYSLAFSKRIRKETWFSRLISSLLEIILFAKADWQLSLDLASRIYSMKSVSTSRAGLNCYFQIIPPRQALVFAAILFLKVRACNSWQRS